MPPTIGAASAGVPGRAPSIGTIDPALLIDVAAEQSTLDAMLSSMPPEEWRRATPAAGWTVTDQVRHLAVSERAAALALAGRSAEVFGAGAQPTEDPGHDPAAVLQAWREARSATLDGLRPLGDRDRVIWGAGPMSARSFADARLMETWAHGLDCFAAAGITPVDTVRLRRVAGLGYRALPYAFRVADRQPPGDLDDLALDLAGPDGGRWRFGPEASRDVIVGSAGDWCRVATRRRPVAETSLRAATPLGRAALEVARAYLVG